MSTIYIVLRLWNTTNTRPTINVTTTSGGPVDLATSNTNTISETTSIDDTQTDATYNIRVDMDTTSTPDASLWIAACTWNKTKARECLEDAVKDAGGDKAIWQKENHVKIWDGGDAYTWWQIWTVLVGRDAPVVLG